MNLPSQLAKHLREVFFGGNWTDSNLKDVLSDVQWQHSITKVYSLNTIATLVYHMNYFVKPIMKVLQGEALVAKDKYSFDHPPINSEEDWKNMLNELWVDAEKYINLIEQIPEEKLWEDFTDAKYGTYYRNIHGFIEHFHYHLGQISLIKKMIRENKT